MTSKTQIVMPEPLANDPTEEMTSVAQLLEYMQQMKHQIKLLEKKATNTPPEKIDLPKPAKPSTFGGKTGESVDTWIFTIEQYFRLVKAPAETQILLAASYLIDNAATWWRYVSIENEHLGTTWTWSDFTSGLQLQF